MITTGTYKRLPHLSSPERLDFFQDSLFRYASEFGWNLRAWAVLSNHYHFIAASPADAATLRNSSANFTAKPLGSLIAGTKRTGGRSGSSFWDSHITFERSYLARLKYVHHNPAVHGVVPVAENYKWCSAAWFAQTAPAALVNTVNSFKIDQVNVPDDF